ncbi:hypothetical protein GCM10017744_088590 [Streptomyces antimycoticus]|uniref:Uncharacterized protein n=1 Tax=Streptomyces antimycoticus TaxID=68175 RepID=A0A4D4JYM6_9ACTN|nr:hypothetical protein SANT12839_000510 [Streptomyces antimycoticus]
MIPKVIMEPSTPSGMPHFHYCPRAASRPTGRAPHPEGNSLTETPPLRPLSEGPGIQEIAGHYSLMRLTGPGGTMLPSGVIVTMPTVQKAALSAHRAAVRLLPAMPMTPSRPGTAGDNCVRVQ